MVAKHIARLTVTSYLLPKLLLNFHPGGTLQPGKLFAMKPTATCPSITARRLVLLLAVLIMMAGVCSASHRQSRCSTCSSDAVPRQSINLVDSVEDACRSFASDEALISLIGHNASRERRLTDGFTVMHILARYERSGVLRRYQKLHDNMDPLDNNGRSPFWEMCYYGYSKLAGKWLKALKKGKINFDPCRQIPSGQFRGFTPLKVAGGWAKGELVKEDGGRLTERPARTAEEYQKIERMLSEICTAVRPKHSIPSQLDTNGITTDNQQVTSAAKGLPAAAQGREAEMTFPELPTLTWIVTVIVILRKMYEANTTAGIKHFATRASDSPKDVAIPRREAESTTFQPLPTLSAVGIQRVACAPGSPQDVAEFRDAEVATDLQQPEDAAEHFEFENIDDATSAQRPPEGSANSIETPAEIQQEGHSSSTFTDLQIASPQLPQVGDVSWDVKVHLAHDPHDVNPSARGVDERGPWILAQTAFVMCIGRASLPAVDSDGHVGRRYDTMKCYLKFDCQTLKVPPSVTPAVRSSPSSPHKEKVVLPVCIDGHRILFFLARVCGLSAFEIENVPNAFCPTGNFTVRLPSDEAERFKQLVASITLYFDLSTGMVVLTNDMPESAAWVDAKCKVKVAYRRTGKGVCLASSETVAGDARHAYQLVTEVAAASSQRRHSNEKKKRLARNSKRGREHSSRGGDSPYLHLGNVAGEAVSYQTWSTRSDQHPQSQWYPPGCAYAEDTQFQPMQRQYLAPWYPHTAESQLRYHQETYDPRLYRSPPQNDRQAQEQAFHPFCPDSSFPVSDPTVDCPVVEAVSVPPRRIKQHDPYAASVVVAPPMSPSSY